MLSNVIGLGRRNLLDKRDIQFSVEFVLACRSDHMGNTIRTCLACGSDLVFFASGGGGEGTRGLYECVQADCELRGMSQPERDGQSIAGFGSEGRITFIQQGPTSENEENLPSVVAHFENAMPTNFNFDIVRGAESGADLIARCEMCKAKIEIQVARAIDSGLARKNRHQAVAWAQYRPDEVVQRIIAVVDRKTNKYPESDRAQRVLALDASVDAVWTPILGGLDQMRSLMSGRGWRSIVLVGPAAVIALAGEDVGHWCGCRQ